MQWEYLTRFIQARATDKEVRRYLKDELEVKRVKRFQPEAMIPELNELGEDGWEIIHMEPVAKVGGKGDILVSTDYFWTSTYFCVFKRPKPGSLEAHNNAPTMSAQSAPPVNDTDAAPASDNSVPILPGVDD